jgi:threonine dehydratase
MEPPLNARERIKLANKVIGTRIIRTPILKIAKDDIGIGYPVILKLEYLQHSGSFKARGALHSLMKLDVGVDGVLAASGGNHGIAVAWAAKELGHAANIFVPTITSDSKIKKLEKHGATIHQTGENYAEAFEASATFAASRKMTTVHAYDQVEVLEGAGTIALELDDQCPEVTTIVVACGGGGLSGGLASWWGTKKRLIVVETEGTGTYAAAKKLARPVDIDVSGIAADALGARRIGTQGWEALTSVAAESLLIRDDDVIDAQAVLRNVHGMEVEPAAALGVAALRSGNVRISERENVALVICGANST